MWDHGWTKSGESVFLFLLRWFLNTCVFQWKSLDIFCLFRLFCLPPALAATTLWKGGVSWAPVPDKIRNSYISTFIHLFVSLSTSCGALKISCHLNDSSSQVRVWRYFGRIPEDLCRSFRWRKQIPDERYSCNNQQQRILAPVFTE